MKKIERIARQFRNALDAAWEDGIGFYNCFKKYVFLRRKYDGRSILGKGN